MIENLSVTKTVTYTDEAGDSLIVEIGEYSGEKTVNLSTKPGVTVCVPLAHIEALAEALNDLADNA